MLIYPDLDGSLDKGRQCFFTADGISARLKDYQIKEKTKCHQIQQNMQHFNKVSSMK